MGENLLGGLTPSHRRTPQRRIYNYIIRQHNYIMLGSFFDSLIISIPTPSNIFDIALIVYGLYSVLTEEPSVHEKYTITEIIEAIEETTTFHNSWYIKKFCRKLRKSQAKSFAECLQTIKMLIPAHAYNEVMATVRDLYCHDHTGHYVIVKQPDSTIMLGVSIPND